MSKTITIECGPCDGSGVLWPTVDTTCPDCKGSGVIYKAVPAKAKKKLVKVPDPSWVSIYPWIAALIQRGDKKGVATAMKALKKMAYMADAYIIVSNKNKRNPN